MKNISFAKAAFLFIITSCMIYCNLYYLMPFCIDNGITVLVSYLALFYFPFIIIFLLSIILYQKEGGRLAVKDIFERFRIRKFSKKDTYFAVSLFLFGITSYLILLPVGKYFAAISIFSPPDFFPAEINPNKNPITGQFMGTPMKGQYWLPVIYFVGWIFNILGEEFLWRGYLFPRQELKHGKNTWIIHGLMWALWHWFWKWNLLSILPFNLALSYSVQKTKNTSVGIFAHGLMNFIPLLFIFSGVLS